MSGIIFQVQSIFILGLLFYGAYLGRKKLRSRHIRVVSWAIGLDILLILQIELTRDAIAKSTEISKNPALLTIHIALAITSVLLYGIMAYTGRRVMKGDQSIRKAHLSLGLLTLVVRSLTLLTSLWYTFHHQLKLI